MTRTRTAYETPSPWETPTPERIAALMQQVWSSADEPERFRLIELAISEVVQRRPNAANRANAALNAVLDEVGSEAEAILASLKADGQIVAVVDRRGMARFVGGLGCRQLPDPPAAYHHQHVGKLVLELGAVSMWSVIQSAQQQPGQLVQGYDTEWMHSARAGACLTLVMSARRPQ